MSVNKTAHHEIVIIKRRGGDGDGGHHGGVWKIAYADFMTAMMAFFLVMWLVNAADKKVLTQVATYFNPMPLSDRVTAKKGVDDLVAGGPEASEGTINRTSLRNEKSEQQKTGNPAAPNLPSIREQPAAGDSPSVAPDGFENWKETKEPTVLPAPEGKAAEHASGNAAVEQAIQQLKAAVADGVASLAGDGLRIEVSAEKDAVLLTLMDGTKAEMFAVGSVEPNKALSVLLARLAPRLSTIPGDVIVRGHTDSRPFRREPGGNWSLSSRRATSVQTVLFDSGIYAKRFLRIEAYADSRPLDTQNPMAAENRRIEILLQPPAGSVQQ
jgi:chemotaxis protein MotB